MRRRSACAFALWPSWVCSATLCGSPHTRRRRAVSLVGIIANPSSGKDIRRLVAMGSVVDNNEKVNIVRRVLTGLRATGVEQVVHMPDHFGITTRAAESLRG